MIGWAVIPFGEGPGASRISTSESSISSPFPRSVFMASSSSGWASATPSTRSSGRCARQRRWCLTKSAMGFIIITVLILRGVAEPQRTSFAPSRADWGLLGSSCGRSCRCSSCSWSSRSLAEDQPFALRPSGSRGNRSWSPGSSQSGLLVDDLRCSSSSANTRTSILLMSAHAWRSCSWGAGWRRRRSTSSRSFRFPIVVWFLLKISFVVVLSSLWVRATLPLAIATTS